MLDVFPLHALLSVSKGVDNDIRASPGNLWADSNTLPTINLMRKNFESTSNRVKDLRTQTQNRTEDNQLRLRSTVVVIGASYIHARTQRHGFEMLPCNLVSFL